MITCKIQEGRYEFTVKPQDEAQHNTVIGIGTNLKALMAPIPDGFVVVFPFQALDQTKQFIADCTASGFKVDVDQIRVPDFTALNRTLNIAHQGKMTPQIIGSMLRTVNDTALSYKARERLELSE